MYLIQYSANGRPFTVHLDIHNVQSREQALAYSRSSLQEVLAREDDEVDFSLVRIDEITKELWTAVYGEKGSGDLDYEIEQDRLAKEEAEVLRIAAQEAAKQALEAGYGPSN